MAAIARFVSHDGGIAFSDSVVKVQKRDSASGTIIPLEDVVSVEVQRPQPDLYGCVDVQSADGKTHTICFEDDQLEDALRFRKRLLAAVSAAGGEDPAPAPARTSRKGGREDRRETKQGRSPREERPPRNEKKASLFRQWWFWVILLLLLAVAAVGFLLWNTVSGGAEEPQLTAAVQDPEPTPEEEAEPVEEFEDGEVPADYEAALSRAESYSQLMHMSKAGIYAQLTNEHGDKFPDAAARYAVEHMTADWNANALASAESYSRTMHMSKAGIYDQLTSEFGEGFTPEEAQYAIDNVSADWNANALAKAQSYLEQDMSAEAIREQLTSQYGEQFTPEEAQYAIDNLGS